MTLPHIAMAENRDLRYSPVGFVGLGRMGVPMATRLAAAGFTVVGFDASPASADRLAGTGVRIGAELAEVGRCRSVILMLPDSSAVEDVLVSSGLLTSLEPGSLVIDMSSSVPGRTRQLAALARQHAVELVDAPVSGGVAGAEHGTLTAMVGGDVGAVALARPLLDTVASRLVLTGEVGSGHATKALNNLMSATHLLVTSEALLAADAFGLDLRLTLEAVNGSSGRSGSTENKWPNFVLPDSFDSGFGIALMVKDMRIALDLESSSGVFAPLSEASVEIWAEAARELASGADHTEIVCWLRERVGRRRSAQVE
jgi:3-hydroxyisobutyrate dehydrogenase